MQDSIRDQSPNTATLSTESTGAKTTDQAAADLKSGVLADAHDLTDNAKRVAGGVVSHARESAADQLATGKDRVADGLGSVAEAIRHSGAHLRSNDAANLTEYAARAADQVEAASDYLKDSSLSEVIEDIGNFARREPAMFLGGAFVLGLVGGRFLKSSHAPTTASSRSTKALTGATGRSQSYAGRQPSARDSGRAQATPTAATSTGGAGTKRQSNHGASRQSSSGMEAPHSNGDGAKMPGAL